MATRIEFVLIHGTFAQNAIWTSDASSFCEAITNGFDIEATFQRPQWSGRYRIADRIAAVDELAILLRKQRKANPDIKQIVIGHSHGGSVLAHALARHTELASTIHAIFLATPFLDARPRRNWFFALVAVIAASLSAITGVGFVALW